MGIFVPLAGRDRSLEEAVRHELLLEESKIDSVNISWNSRAKKAMPLLPPPEFVRELASGCGEFDPACSRGDTTPS